MADRDWPPRLTMTPEAAARLVLLNFIQEQNEEKTVLAMTMLMNEAFEKGRASNQSTGEQT